MVVDCCLKISLDGFMTPLCIQCTCSFALIAAFEEVSTSLSSHMDCGRESQSLVTSQEILVGSLVRHTVNLLLETMGGLAWFQGQWYAYFLGSQKQTCA